MVFLNKLVRPIKLKTLLYLAAAIFKNAKTVGHPKDRSLEIKVTAGLSRNTTFGKFYSMVLLLEQTR